jgi:dipeptidyl aminopeptidase/acylaminoacyl peptidase
MAIRWILSTALIALWATPAYAAVPGPNGKIAFERGFNVWTVEPDGSSPAQVTTTGATFSPAQSPDGRRLALNRGGDIWVMDADGGNPRNISGPLGSTDQQPAWSPDGTRIAFSRSIQGQPTYRIWVIDADGSGPVQLTSSSSGDFSPAWSPDGTRIAYTRLGNSSDIYTVDPTQPGVETPYANTTFTEDQPTWAPDGSAIAFTTNRQDGNGNEIYKQVGAGATAVPVTSSTANDNDPSWAPDGTRIAFTSNRSGHDQVWTVDANGVEGSPQNVSGSSTPDGQPDWAVKAAPEPLPAPEIGETVNARPVKGRVRVRVPGAGFVALEEAGQVPVGSTFDTRKGTVALTLGASRTTGKTQTGRFSGGKFITRQSRRDPLTELRLTGGGFNRCSAKGASAAARKPSRRLFANGRGRFRTRGRNSTATVRGTKWLTKDTCAGTLTLVQQGSVVVRDLVKRRTVLVKAGGRYLARSRKR